MTEYQTDAAQVDWKNLEREAVEHIERVRLAWIASQADMSAAHHANFVAKIYVPSIRKLAAFCAFVDETIELEDEENDASIGLLLEDTPPPKIPVAEAKRLASYGRFQGVVIFAFTEDGRISATSYGDCPAACRRYARWLDGVFDRLEKGKLPAP